jgi:CubicO group peptidase (beta-lactamase class C family)
VDFDSTFWGASCTKLVTVIAALQIVEQGLVDLDEDITRILHEWKDPIVLEGFDESGQPITRPAKKKMTLRYDEFMSLDITISLPNSHVDIS